MNKKPAIKLIFALMLLVALTFAAGCGGGGGGGGASSGTDYEPTSVLAPNTLSTLAVDGAFYGHTDTAANVSIKIPVSSEEVRFALTVTNTSNASQAIALKPESYVTNSYAASVKPAVIASARPLSAIEEARARQLPTELRLREIFLDNMRRNAGNIRAGRSLRASNHSGEQEGDLVDLWILADSNAYNYATRTCRLEKITSHAKFFVDQNPYLGLSTVTGVYQVTAANIEHFATEFETHIYSLLKDGYGDIYDIDNDGRVSLVISPVYTKLGYAGLFNPYHLDPSNPAKSNQRDMVGLWSPYNGTSGDKWLTDTRETIAHELQHLTNFSAKAYPGGVVRTGDYNSFLETMWLDESLSVGVEARYRLLRGDSAGSDARFTSWAEDPTSVAMTDFSYDMFAP
ncbi:MAG: hypothetical protein PHV05_07550, partial [Candidatus Riflebacteria bacterium]|nr:hypothetical protein [Candidatus Riflebacteria bacterium]